VRQSTDLDISNSTIGGGDSPSKGNSYAMVDQDIDSFRDSTFLRRQSSLNSVDQVYRETMKQNSNTIIQSDLPYRDAIRALEKMQQCVTPREKL
jgi:hypothetical protein